MPDIHLPAALFAPWHPTWVDFIYGLGGGILGWWIGYYLAAMFHPSRRTRDWTNWQYACAALTAIIFLVGRNGMGQF